MGVRRRPDCKYRSNGRPPRKAQFGPHVRDANTSFPTYEYRLVRDDWGQLVDPRFGGIDSNEQDDGRNGGN
jgi:hypothetical protein